MQEIARRIREILMAECSLHKELLKLSQDKREAIVKNNVDDLDLIVKSEQTLLAQLSDYEKHRKEQATQVARHLNKPETDLVLRDVFPFAAPEVRDSLIALNDELKSLLEQQAKLNEVNRGLIESRLQFINFAMETMSAPGAVQSNTYGSRGLDAAQPQRKHSFMDKSV